MNINLTLIGQSIAFAIFVLFCMKFIWPALMGAIEERQRKIAEGLNAAEKAKLDLANAEQSVEQELATAKVKAAALIELYQQPSMKNIGKKIPTSFAYSIDSSTNDFIELIQSEIIQNTIREIQ